jgi:hypothetical protein
MQTAKGLLTAGPRKALTYAMEKVLKRLKAA